MKSVFYAGAGIQSVLFFLNDGYLSATLACGSGVSPRTVRWGRDPAAAGSRAGDGMARFVSEEKAPGTQACPTSLYDQRTAVQR